MGLGVKDIRCEMGGNNCRNMLMKEIRAVQLT